MSCQDLVADSLQALPRLFLVEQLRFAVVLLPALSVAALATLRVAPALLTPPSLSEFAPCFAFLASILFT